MLFIIGFDSLGLYNYIYYEIKYIFKIRTMF